MKPSILKLCFLAVGMLLFCCGNDDGPHNQDPEKTVLTNPSNQSQEVDIENLNLQWQQVSDSDGDLILYDVFLDSLSPPTKKITADLNTTSYVVGGTLDFNKTYYWNILAKDGNGGTSLSEVSVFTTRGAHPEELIAGKWFIHSLVNNGVLVELSPCAQTSYFEFDTDGTVSILVYDDGDPCIITSSDLALYDMPDAMTLSITNEGTTETVPIVVLTETELKINLSGIQYNLVKED